MDVIASEVRRAGRAATVLAVGCSWKCESCGGRRLILDYTHNSLGYCAHVEAAVVASEEGCREFFIRTRTDGLGITSHELFERDADGFERVVGSSTCVNDMYELMFDLQDAVSEGMAA